METTTVEAKRTPGGPTKAELKATAALNKDMLAAWTAYMGSDDRTDESPVGKHDIEEMRTDGEYEAVILEWVLGKWADFEHAGKPAECDYETTVAVCRAALNVMPFGWYRGDLIGRVRRRVREQT